MARGADARIERKRRVILLADHDVWSRQLAAEALADAGFEVLQASNGWTALRLAASEQPDVVVVDPRLPERSGEDVLEALVAGSGATRSPVVLLTADPSILIRMGMFRVSAALRKPYGVLELLQCVEQVLAEAAERRRVRLEAVPPTGRPHDVAPVPRVEGPVPRSSDDTQVRDVESAPASAA